MVKFTAFCLFCLLLIGCQKQQTHQVVPPPLMQQTPIFVPPVVPQKVEGTYKGTWVATNRQIDGTMQCVVNDLGNGKWKGTFSGVWFGRRFSYNVDWTGTAGDLRGTAVIDGANYQWTGSITQDTFKGTYTGNRYNGSFNLKK